LKNPRSGYDLSRKKQINFSSEGWGRMMVNVIFKGRASATDFHVCQFCTFPEWKKTRANV